jgi:hypothetical protein
VEAWQSSANKDPYEVLNTRDVAKILRCGRRKIQREAACGKLPMKKFGGESSSPASA